MNFKSIKRIAGKILSISPKKVKFDNIKLDEIKEAITKSDIRALISSKAITKEKSNAKSSGRKRKRLLRIRKGRQKGHGTRKGKRTARLPRKKAWIIKIRSQRTFIESIRDKLSIKNYRTLRSKAKGGFFRSIRHIKLYITEHKLLSPKKVIQNEEIKNTKIS